MGEPEKQSVTAAEPPVPSEGITVEISYATVPAFERAVEVARRHPSCQQFGEGKTLRVRVTYGLEELDALQGLKDVCWDLHHKRAFLQGAEIAWHQMAELTYCFRELMRRPRREHCFFDGNFWSGFGCRYAIANLSDHINNEWLSYGHLESGGAWVFDKGRIAAHVRQNLSAGFEHCPAFDADYLELFLELFPERVDPVEDDRWRHVNNRQGQILGVGPKGVDTAKKIVFELQDKIRQRRAASANPGTGSFQENGKRKLPAALVKAYQTPAKKKKGFLARLVG